MPKPKPKPNSKSTSKSKGLSASAEASDQQKIQSFFGATSLSLPTTLPSTTAFPSQAASIPKPKMKTNAKTGGQSKAAMAPDQQKIQSFFGAPLSVPSSLASAGRTVLAAVLSVDQRCNRDTSNESNVEDENVDEDQEADALSFDNSVNENCHVFQYHNKLPDSLGPIVGRNGNDDDDDDDDDEELVCEATVPINKLLASRTPSDDRLFSTTVSAQDIIQDAYRILPDLSRMADFITETVKPQVAAARPLSLPIIQTDPLTWSNVDPEIDAAWSAAVAAELQLNLGTLPNGLSMEPRHLVKPSGSFDAPFLVLSSYPTLDPASTVHMDYATANDMSNICMFALYAKLGFHKANIRPCNMLHIDIFPRRIDRKEMDVGPRGAISLLQQMPALLVRHWLGFAFDCLAVSRASVMIVAGAAGAKAYMRYLRVRKIPHEVIWMNGRKENKNDIPGAWFEKRRVNGELKIVRIVIGTYHPEAFERFKSAGPIRDLQRTIACRERLMDFALVALFGQTHMPSFLSTCNWTWSAASGIIIPVEAFRQFNYPDNDTLSAFFRRPLCNTGTMDKMIARNQDILAKKSDIYKVRKAVNVKPMDGAAWWMLQGPTQAEYGPYCVTYQLLAQRYYDQKNESRINNRKRIKSLPEEEQEEIRVHTNNLVYARNKRYKAEGRM